LRREWSGELQSGNIRNHQLSHLDSKSAFLCAANSRPPA
jgi:hypothetical protein